MIRLVRIGLALTVLGVDQISKHLVLEMFKASKEPVEVYSWFHWVLVWNKGVTFGLFHDHLAFQKILVVLISAITLGCGWWALRVDTMKEGVLWSLMCGAALGNLTDRLRFGAVVDFIDWSYGPYHWPAFNVADSVLVLCCGILCLQHLYSGSNPFKKEG